jgi:hypothetical protein
LRNETRENVMNFEGRSVTKEASEAKSLARRRRSDFRERRDGRRGGEKRLKERSLQEEAALNGQDRSVPKGVM